MAQPITLQTIAMPNFSDANQAFAIGGEMVNKGLGQFAQSLGYLTPEQEAQQQEMALRQQAIDIDNQALLQRASQFDRTLAQTDSQFVKTFGLEEDKFAHQQDVDKWTSDTNLIKAKASVIKNNADLLRAEAEYAKQAAKNDPNRPLTEAEEKAKNLRLQRERADEVESLIGQGYKNASVDLDFGRITGLADGSYKSPMQRKLAESGLGGITYEKSTIPGSTAAHVTTPKMEGWPTWKVDAYMQGVDKAVTSRTALSAQGQAAIADTKAYVDNIVATQNSLIDKTVEQAYADYGINRNYVNIIHNKDSTPLSFDQLKGMIGSNVADDVVEDLIKVFNDKDLPLTEATMMMILPEAENRTKRIAGVHIGLTEGVARQMAEKVRRRGAYYYDQYKAVKEIASIVDELKRKNVRSGTLMNQRIHESALINRSQGETNDYDTLATFRQIHSGRKDTQFATGDYAAELFRQVGLKKVNMHEERQEKPNVHDIK